MHRAAPANPAKVVTHTGRYVLSQPVSKVRTEPEERPPMPQDAPVAENVARRRLDRRLIQTALAEQAGVSRVALGRVERGDVLPRARMERRDRPITRPVGHRW